MTSRRAPHLHAAARTAPLALALALALAPVAGAAAASLQAEIDGAPKGVVELAAGEHAGPAVAAKSLKIHGPAAGGARIVSGGSESPMLTVRAASGDLVRVQGVELVGPAARGVAVESGTLELVSVHVKDVRQPVYVAAAGVAVYERSWNGAALTADGPGLFVHGHGYKASVVDGTGAPVPGARIEIVTHSGRSIAARVSGLDGVAYAFAPDGAREGGADRTLDGWFVRVTAGGHAPRTWALPAAGVTSVTYDVAGTDAGATPTSASRPAPALVTDAADAAPDTAAPAPATAADEITAPATGDDAAPAASAPAVAPPPERTWTVGQAAAAAWSAMSPTARGATVAATGGLAAAGAAWRAARDERRWLKWLLLALPLYTRLAPARLLDQPTRERIHAFVKEHPGAHYREIRRALALPNGVAAHHLQILVRDRYLREEKQGVFLRYYPIDVAPATVPRAPDTAEKVLAFLKGAPGATASAVAQAVGVSPSLVSYHLDRLETAGRLARVRKGREVLLYPL